jgi:hypothetical protein
MTGRSSAPELLLDRIIAYFAQRRDAVDVVGRFGNRFEDWFKWEAAIALHRCAFLDSGGDIASVAVERDNCDLFLGHNVWPDAGYPESANDDVWVELKVRCTRDKGPADLAEELALDIERQRARKASVGKGAFLTVAAIVQHPKGAGVERWVEALQSDRRLARNAIVRRLHADSKAETEGRVLLALTGWSV